MVNIQVKWLMFFLNDRDLFVSVQIYEISIRYSSLVTRL